MSKVSIPVDLTNPGQVFACLGFVEIADILLGAASGGFDWELGSDDANFWLSTPGNDNPAEHVLCFLRKAAVRSVAPIGSGLSTERWHVETDIGKSREFPFRAPSKPATLPARLESDMGTVTIAYWGDSTRCDNVKFWAGAGGYPGAALAQDALRLIQGKTLDATEKLFDLAAEQGSSFRFDWRRDYVPLDAGFSPNNHQDVTMQGYPIVEIMAAVGLSYARPKRHQKLLYSYGVAGIRNGQLYDPIFLRASLGASKPLFPDMPFRLFGMSLNWPGQEGQARCITNVTEETFYHEQI